MAGLNQELKEFLARPEKSGKLASVSTSSLSKWFTKTTDRRPTSENLNGGAISSEGNGRWFEDAESDPIFPTLSRKQRILGFMGCLTLGVVCFVMAGLYIPLLLLKARKFAFLYTLGSLFIISSFSLLWGPWNHLKHLLARDHLPFTTVYFGTMIGTLYAALWVRSTPLSAVFAGLQAVALCWYIASHIPGGQTGLRFFSKVFTSAVMKTASKTLPV